MPRHAIICQRCGEASDEVYSANGKPRCPECGSHHVRTDWTKTNLAKHTDREWQGSEGRSHRFAFNPKGRAKLAAEGCPTLADCVQSDGSVMYKNDSTQRKVFHEMRVAKERAERQLDEEAAMAKDETDR